MNQGCVNRLKAQISAIENGEMFSASCINPELANPDLQRDLVRLIHAVQKQRIISIELQVKHSHSILYSD